MGSEPTPESLKELGNKAVQEKKYTEAILHYTHAIKLNPINHVLYSNRSYAFLNEQQYYLALEDANETIRLSPSWAKGYFRKAEVEFAAHHYLEACQSYKKALELQPDDIKILESLNRASREILKAHRADETTPWLGAGIGLIVGVCIMISDYIFTANPTHPILMSLVTIVIAMIGYGLAKTYRYFNRVSKEGLLEPPPLLDFDNEKEPTNEEEHRTHTRYTKSQARQRYKKGKM
ncbi:STI1-like protein [Coccinella septempunctata]|uniref:STI1-like protein n=1 Tax=Coccinella septempunctata TaxID=41139 RepID=UPI001D064DEB|nr:STI1-like protein [Coccinella septempunctata]